MFNNYNGQVYNYNDQVYNYNDQVYNYNGQVYNYNDQVYNYNGQVLQDKFVASVLKFKRNGYFVEIGSNHPQIINNTYFLEKELNWSGIMIDYDNQWIPYYEKERINSIYIIKNALDINYKDILIKNNLPKNIDYLQIDLEVSNRSTLSTLELLDNTIFSEYKFATVTFEHDIYDGNKFDTRLASRQIFLNRGYILVFPDVINNSSAFEDWYVHPDLVDMIFINNIKTDLSLNYNLIMKIIDDNINNIISGPSYNTISDTISDTISGPLYNTISDTISDPLYNTISDTISLLYKTISDTISNPLYNTISDTISSPLYNTSDTIAIDMNNDIAFDINNITNNLIYNTESNTISDTITLDTTIFDTTIFDTTAALNTAAINTVTLDTSSDFITIDVASLNTTLNTTTLNTTTLDTTTFGITLDSIL